MIVARSLNPVRAFFTNNESASDSLPQRKHAAPRNFLRGGHQRAGVGDADDGSNTHDALLRCARHVAAARYRDGARDSHRARRQLCGRRRRCRGWRFGHFAAISTMSAIRCERCDLQRVLQQPLWLRLWLRHLAATQCRRGCRRSCRCRRRCRGPRRPRLGGIRRHYRRGCRQWQVYLRPHVTQTLARPRALHRR